MNQDQKQIVGISDEETGMHFTFHLTKKEIDLMDDLHTDGRTMLEAYQEMRKIIPAPKREDKD